MKKYIILVATLCYIGFANGQSYEDALRFSQNIYEGTARFQGMGGAFSALGGDFTTLSINPAGSGIYRMSEFMVTPTLAILSTKTDYIQRQNLSEETRGHLGLGNIGYIGIFNSHNSEGLISVNFGFGMNKLQNNTQRFSASATTDRTSFAQSIAVGLTGVHFSDLKDRQGDVTSTENLAWRTYLVDTISGNHYEYIAATEDGMNLKVMGPLKQSFYRDQKGYVREYVFNMGFNVSNKYFFGMTFGMQDIKNDFYQEAKEEPVNANDFFETEFRKMHHEMTILTSGMGYNLKLGAIVLPVDGLRLGAYIHTPTWMFLTEEWDERMRSSVSHPSTRDTEHDESLNGVFDYRIRTPFKWGAGVAYTFGSYGLLSIDYEGVDYSHTRMYGSSHSNRNMFQKDNNYVRNYCRTTTNIRAGGELKIDNFSLRGGYSFYQNPEKDMPNTHIGSVGMGFRTRGFFLDVAYSFIPNLQKDNAPYGNTDYSMNTDTFYSKILMTFGFRF